VSEPVYTEVANDSEKAAARVAHKLLLENPPYSGQHVIIKPNIVNNSPPPVTTDVRVVKGIVTALKEAGVARIFVADGSGCGNTLENMQQLGYDAGEAERVDLDTLPFDLREVPGAEVWSELYLPRFLNGAFIVSVPVLKEHSMLGVTLSLKNMVGILPSARYGGYWTYKKSEIHRTDAHACTADLIRAVRPHWAVVDASIGMKGSHLSGARCSPPHNIIYGSSDAFEADKHGCSLLDHEWTNIPYLRKVAEFWPENKRSGIPGPDR